MTKIQNQKGSDKDTGLKKRSLVQKFTTNLRLYESQVKSQKLQNNGEDIKFISLKQIYPADKRKGYIAKFNNTEHKILSYIVKQIDNAVGYPINKNELMLYFDKEDKIDESKLAEQIQKLIDKINIYNKNYKLLEFGLQNIKTAVSSYKNKNVEININRNLDTSTASVSINVLYIYGIDYIWLKNKDFWKKFVSRYTLPVTIRTDLSDGFLNMQISGNFTIELDTSGKEDRIIEYLTDLYKFVMFGSDNLAEKIILEGTKTALAFKNNFISADKIFR